MPPTIVSNVRDVQETLFIAFVLVVAVIYMFLGRATDTLIPVVALPLSLLITFIVAPWFIRRARERQLGELIRDDGPASHAKKQGTPTMGGALIIMALAAGKGCRIVDARVRVAAK